jgi:poly(3-hydroxyalkanoate) depolymerase
MTSKAEAAQQPRGETVTIGSQRLRVIIRPGNGRRTPLLLVNGLGAALEVFQPFLDEIDPDIEVISFDVPGIGGSPLPAIPYCPASLAVLVARMLDTLGYRQVDVLGVSWGGWLAQQFALQYRQRCRRLILVASSPGVFMVPGRPRAMLSLLTPWRLVDHSFIEKIAPELFGGEPQSNPQRLREFAHAVRSSNLSGYSYQLFAGVGWSSLPWLWLLPQPTLIIAGDDDHLVPLANAQILRSLIPRSELSIYRGGHLGIVMNVEEITPVIERFLSPV